MSKQAISCFNFKKTLPHRDVMHLLDAPAQRTKIITAAKVTSTGT